MPQKCAIVAFTLIVMLSSACSKPEGKPSSPPNKGPDATGIDKGKEIDKGKDPGKKENVKRPDFSLTAEAFTKEFVANAEAAKQKYADKVVELTGEVMWVDVGRFRKEKQVTVAFESIAINPTRSTSTRCKLLPEHHAKAVYLSPKQKIKITGTFDDTYEVLMDCSLEELTPSKIIQVSAEELSKEFGKNVEAAKGKYDDKAMIVSGLVEELTKEETTGSYDAKLKGDGKWQIFVRIPLEEFASLKKGQTVRMRVIRRPIDTANNHIVLSQGIVLDTK